MAMLMTMIIVQRLCINTQAGTSFTVSDAYLSYDTAKGLVFTLLALVAPTMNRLIAI